MGSATRQAARAASRRRGVEQRRFVGGRLVDPTRPAALGGPRERAIKGTSLCCEPVSQIHGPVYSVSISAHHLGLLFVTGLVPRAPC